MDLSSLLLVARVISWMGNMVCGFHSYSVIFGRVLDGLLTLKKIENVPTIGGNNRYLIRFDKRPKMEILITQCGEM